MTEDVAGPQFEIRALTPEGEQIGSVKTGADGAQVEVLQAHQRKGIGTLLMDTAEKNGAKAPDRVAVSTPEAQAFMDARKPPEQIAVGSKAPERAEPVKAQEQGTPRDLKAEMIGLRKEQSVLTKLLGCLNG